LIPATVCYRLLFSRLAVERKKEGGGREQIGEAWSSSGAQGKKETGSLCVFAAASEKKKKKKKKKEQKPLCSNLQTVHSPAGKKGRKRGGRRSPPFILLSLKW